MAKKSSIGFLFLISASMFAMEKSTVDKAQKKDYIPTQQDFCRDDCEPDYHELNSSDAYKQKQKKNGQYLFRSKNSNADGQIAKLIFDKNKKFDHVYFSNPKVKRPLRNSAQRSNGSPCKTDGLWGYVQKNRLKLVLGCLLLGSILYIGNKHRMVGKK